MSESVSAFGVDHGDEIFKAQPPLPTLGIAAAHGAKKTAAAGPKHRAPGKAKQPGVLSRMGASLRGGGRASAQQRGARRQTVNAMRPRGPGQATPTSTAAGPTTFTPPTAGSAAATSTATKEPRRFGVGSMAGAGAAGGIGGYWTNKYLSGGGQS